MARHNDISFYGIVMKQPVLKESGTKTKAVFSMKVFKGDRNSYDGDVQIKATTPLIATTNPVLVEEIKKLKLNDVIMLKGNIITSVLRKNRVCPHCSESNMVEEMFSYINPIAIVPVISNLDYKEAENNVLKNREFSNEACIIGHLCNNPETVAAVTNVTVAQYKIGIPRKFNIKWDKDNQDIKADFPFVKSYGQNAIDDLAVLKEGSTVLIDGYLQTRYFDKGRECEHCGEIYKWKASVLEIVPYQTEYLRNYKGSDKDANTIKNTSTERGV